MTNLFSSFDPGIRIFSIKIRLNWRAGLIAVLITPQSYWLLNSQLTRRFISVIIFLKNELGAVFGGGALPGTSYLFIRLFFFILFSNLMGVIPYIFTRTSHMSVTLILSLPLWIGTIFYSVLFQYNSLLAHLVPTVTPGPLIPVIVVIETVSNIR